MKSVMKKIRANFNEQESNEIYNSIFNCIESLVRNLDYVELEQLKNKTMKMFGVSEFINDCKMYEYISLYIMNSENNFC